VTLWEILVGFSRLVAPFTPFIAESIYQNLVVRVDPKAPRSVHLCDYPVVDTAKLDEMLERRMGFVMRVVQLGRAARNEDNLKVRQPLAEMKVVAPDAADRAALEAMQAIVMEELNVKAVTMLADGGALTNYIIKPNFRTIGKGPYKAFIPKIKAHLEAANGNDVHTAIAGGGYAFEIDGNPVTLKAEDVEVCTQAAGELAVQTEGTLTVALDKKLTRPLILEGLARELVNKIQFMRKETGLEVQDRIRAAWHVADETKRADIVEMLLNHGDYICQETLAVSLQAMSDPTAGSEWNCNGIMVRVQISKEQTQ
ncbi:class I tRNA ligase family protein, partial [Candidatus Ozemobacteraceae bacterium]|nr:class I tRNA ligase family protein [Candidatus Ozemobacteraceae bacterium]